MAKVNGGPINGGQHFLVETKDMPDNLPEKTTTTTTTTTTTKTTKVNAGRHFLVKTKDMPDNLPEKTQENPHQEKSTKVKFDKTFGSSQLLPDQEGLKKKKYNRSNDKMERKGPNPFFRSAQLFPEEVIIFSCSQTAL